MTPAARSIYVFGIYLLALGGMLIGAPNTLLALIRQPPTSEPWIHLVGVPVLAIGLFHVACARAELVQFFQMSVRVRFFVLASLCVMAALRIAPPIVIGFGLIDVAAALWTRAALRSAASRAGAA